jgi:hypothetical protein
LLGITRYCSVFLASEEFTIDGTDDTDKKRVVRIHFPSVSSVPLKEGVVHFCEDFFPLSVSSCSKSFWLRFAALGHPW